MHQANESCFFLYFFIPIKIRSTPRPIKISLVADSFPAIPKIPTAIVEINTIGPTMANIALMATAFSTLLNLNIKVAADNSIIPEMTLRMTIPKTAVSIPANNDFNPLTPWDILSCTTYDKPAIVMNFILKLYEIK